MKFIKTVKSLNAPYGARCFLTRHISDAKAFFGSS